MTKAKKIILTVLAVIFGLLVLSNSFMIWLLVETARSEHGVTDLRPSMYMSALLENNEEELATDDYKRFVADILKEDPYIITREPVIFLANPAIKPIVAEILADEPSILAENPKIISRNPELLELCPDLKDTVKEFLGQSENERNYPALAKLVA
ncbi:MAG: hypothetical protein NC299_08090 [Lachnospiraceae bacterium]|nr:hypothetical protein [Ruminococcus sp.]MCM1275312.1 hypothetical protein [Lachnospiraceae bacterium]